MKVLHNPAHLQYFRQFLEERNADQPVRFWMAVEKLVAEPTAKIKSALVSSIVRNYFHGDVPAGRHPPTLHFTPVRMKASFSLTWLQILDPLAGTCQSSFPCPVFAEGFHCHVFLGRCSTSVAGFPGQDLQPAVPPVAEIALPYPVSFRCSWRPSFTPKICN